MMKHPISKNQTKKTKKLKRLIFATLTFAAIIFLTIWTLMPPPIELFARGAIVMNADNGRILFEKNMHSRLIPSSMTKIMALLLVFESIESGNLSLDDMVIASQEAVSTIASRAGIMQGQAHTVETLIILALLPSGSDAVIALGEHIFGSEAAFVEAMNIRAGELNLENTMFQNSVGLMHVDNFSSAYDMAVLSRYFLTSFPEVLYYASLTTYTLTHENGDQVLLRNTNDMLSVNGVNGLKTGSAPDSGSSIVLTYNNNGRNLIIVVFQSPSTPLRRLDLIALLERFG